MAVVVLGLVGAFVALAFRSEPVVVDVAQISCGDMQVTIDVEGRTRLRSRFIVSAPITGKLGRIALREGDEVKAGAVIAELTPAPLDVRTIRGNEAGSHAAQAQRRAFEAKLEEARVALDQARRKRVEELAAHGIASPQRLEQAILAQSLAEKSYESATFASQAAAYQAAEAESVLLASAVDVPRL
jgi:HlyD family secretion protein